MPAVPVSRSAEIFSLLACDVACRIVEAIGAGGPHVGAIAEAAGASQQATSHHLRNCSLRGLVEMRRVGKRNHYRLTTLGRAALKAIRMFEADEA